MKKSIVKSGVREMVVRRYSEPINFSVREKIEEADREMLRKRGDCPAPVNAAAHL